MTKTTRSVKIWGQRQECFTFTDLHPLAWEEIYWLQEQPLYIVLSSHHDLQLVSSPKEVILSRYSLESIKSLNALLRAPLRDPRTELQFDFRFVFVFVFIKRRKALITNLKRCLF